MINRVQFQPDDVPVQPLREFNANTGFFFYLEFIRVRQRRSVSYSSPPSGSIPPGWFTSTTSP